MNKEMRHQNRSITILMAEVNASQALYLAKQQGSNRVVRFHAGQAKGDR
ncbi:MAG: hypothetical protein WAV05_15440 [Anaerolineales bacterium]